MHPQGLSVHFSAFYFSPVVPVHYNAVLLIAWCGRLPDRKPAPVPRFWGSVGMRGRVSCLGTRTTCVAAIALPRMRLEAHAPLPSQVFRATPSIRPIGAWASKSCPYRFFGYFLCRRKCYSLLHMIQHCPHVLKRMVLRVAQHSVVLALRNLAHVVAFLDFTFRFLFDLRYFRSRVTEWH